MARSSWAINRQRRQSSNVERRNELQHRCGGSTDEDLTPLPVIAHEDLAMIDVHNRRTYATNRAARLRAQGQGECRDRGP